MLVVDRRYIHAEPVIPFHECHVILPPGVSSLLLFTAEAFLYSHKMHIMHKKDCAYFVLLVPSAAIINRFGPLLRLLSAIYVVSYSFPGIRKTIDNLGAHIG
jgi:hypothetical protein